jgi:hypothetical protein
MTDDTSPPTIVSFLRVGKRRLEIFNKACIKFGLTVVDYTTQNSFILIDDELDFFSAIKVLKSSSLLSSTSSPIFIRTQWLSDSIKQNKLLSHQSYIIQAALSIPEASLPETSNPLNKTEIPPEPISSKRDRSISSSASDTDDEPSSKKVFYQLNSSSCFFLDFSRLA